MIQQWSWSITNIFINRNEILDEDGEIYAFGFECILATVIQIFVLFISGLIFDYLLEIALYSLFFTRIKGYIGGYHANTHFSCISGFTIVAILSIYICNLIPFWVSLIFASLGMILVLIFAPIQHINNPKTEKEMIQARKKAVLVAIILVVLICGLLLTPFKQYAIYGAFGFCVATISLIIPSRYYA